MKTLLSNFYYNTKYLGKQVLFFGETDGNLRYITSLIFRSSGAIYL